MKSLFNILAISLMVVFASCEKQEQLGRFETEGDLNIIFKCAKMEGVGTTKALNPDEERNEGTGDGYMVKDYWILQYTSDGNYIDGSAKYIEINPESDNKTPAILPKEGYYYCLFIANTHNPKLDEDKTFDECKSSLSSMTEFVKPISALKDTYNSEIEKPDLIMSGVAKLEAGSTEVRCQLYRNIAKVTVQLINDAGSDLTIKYINIKNIPAGALYADALLKVKQLPGISEVTAPYPDSYSLEYINYTIDNIEGSTPGTTVSLDWYLPRNMRGIVNECTTADMKNKYAPELATYIEVFATTGNGELYRYQFYLGGNATNDFNIEPNKHYKLPITFINKGTVLDSRVTDFSSVTLSKYSNSFIINPLDIPEQPIYSLPLNRINEFWGGMNAPAGNGNMINSETAWVADVIWQDQPERMISFIAENPDKFKGTGMVPLQFKLSGNNIKGNVLIGVRLSGNKKYLWSWHLWITDYNPDECANVPWQTNKYVYRVTGGDVHRYSGDYWNENCMNKYVMDRNLGALSAKKEDGHAMTGGFLYQYGRKDPFPANSEDYSGKLYSIKGEPLTISISSAPVNIYETVNAPNVFFNITKGDWVEDNSFNGYWNSNGKTKSLFDPCPDGWMIPTKGTWDILGNTSFIDNPSNEPSISGVEFCIDAEKENGHKEYNIAYFPAMGNLHPDYGTSNQYGTWINMHSTNDEDINNINCYPYELRIKTNSNNGKISYTIDLGKQSSKAKGISVRCIREKGYSNNGNNNYDDNKNEDYNDVAW